MSITEKIHGSYVHNRRTEVLASWMARLAPQNAKVLDVGCGDGLVARRIQAARPDLQLQGIDVLVRSDAHIQVRAFDGSTIPFDAQSFDVVMFVDVLHHTDDASVLLREARRVARQSVLIKDHRLNGILAGTTLAFMDRVGNARHGVRLPYNYWSEQRWREAFKKAGLMVSQWHTQIGLYPFPANLVFGRGLHFVARLDTAPTSPQVQHQPPAVVENNRI